MNIMIAKSFVFVLLIEIFFNFKFINKYFQVNSLEFFFLILLFFATISFLFLVFRFFYNY